MKKKANKVNSSKSKKIRVGIIMGSDSDWKTMEGAYEVLTSFGVSCEVKVVSAHRTPKYMFEYASSAQKRGVQVIIAGAGGAAHLPGMVAAVTTVPVIGVPVALGPLQGQDALLSIVQMPKGIPVACVAIGNSTNAGLLALQILAFGGTLKDSKLQKKLNDFRDQQKKTVLKKRIQL